VKGCVRAGVDADGRSFRLRRRRERSDVAPVLAVGVRPVSRGRRRISVLRVVERGRL